MIVPEMTMILGVASLFLELSAAAVNCASVETVVTVPPFPPVVLFICQFDNSTYQSGQERDESKPTRHFG